MGSVLHPEHRAILLEELEKLLAEGGPNEQLFALTSVCPYLLDGQFDKAIEMMERLHSDSPYLAYRMWMFADWATTFHVNRQDVDFGDMRQRLQTFARETEFRVTPKDSVLLRASPVYASHLRLRWHRQR